MGSTSPRFHTMRSRNYDVNLGFPLLDRLPLGMEFNAGVGIFLTEVYECFNESKHPKERGYLKQIFSSVLSDIISRNCDLYVLLYNCLFIYLLTRLTNYNMVIILFQLLKLRPKKTCPIIFKIYYRNIEL